MKIITETIIFIVMITGMAVPAHTQDVNSAGTPHPHGITSSGLGTAVTSGGNTFGITGGTQRGGNLFHSFGKFSLHSGERAVFHDAGTENTIGRVTGGEYSWINGNITSAAENLYLLNPAGLMFGPDASLDLGGSFHVSTADYLRLGENDRFYAVPRANDVLSVAAPSAFGFLDGDAGAVTFEGRGEISEQELSDNPPGLRVSEGETISVIGGDIEIRKGTYLMIDTESPNPADPFGDPVEIPRITATGSLSAPEGQISMASVASGGEVVPTESGPDVSSHEKLGNISMSDNSLLDVSGQGAGSIFVRGGRFVASGSGLHSENMGERDAGSVSVEAEEISFTNGAYIDGNTYGGGRGSDVTLKSSGSVTFGGENSLGDASRIVLETHSGNEGAGHCGSLLIEADDDISFRDGTMISNVTFGRGNTGDVTLRAKGSLSFSGQNGDFYRTGLILRFLGEYRERNSGGIFSYISPKSSGGSGGDTLLEAGDITFSDGCSIHSATLGPGSGGDITLRAAGPVSVSDSVGPDIWRGGISSSAFTPGEGAEVGDAGNILVEAGKLTLEDGRFITSSSVVANGGMKSGKAGDVTILVSGEVRLSGASSFPDSQMAPGSFVSSICEDKTGDGSTGDAGKVFLEAGSLILEGGGTISAGTHSTAKGGNVEIRVHDSVRISGKSPVICSEAGECGQGYDAVSAIDAGSHRSSTDAGSGGKISLSAEELILTDSGAISTLTRGGGDAGDINLEVSRLELDNEAVIASVSESETHGGAAGTITVDADSVRVSDNSSMTAEAGSGGSGRITVTAETLILEEGSWIIARTLGEGDAGDINLEVSRLESDNNSGISSSTMSETHGGAAGTITVGADSVRFSDNSGMTTEGVSGDGGRITVSAETLIIEEGGGITASTRGTGEGGNIEIRVRDSVRISGESSAMMICTEAGECMRRPSVIAAVSSRFSADAGSGGKISLSAKELILTDSGAIATSTLGGGDAGDINLEVSRLESDSSALISSESASENHGGAAGTITVDADSVRLSDNSAVRTEAVSAGGGKITVTAENSVCLSGSNITTSVQDGSGNGGDIAVSSPDGEGTQFVILNDSGIEANAHEGAGGNIRIVAGQFVQSSDSVVEASSEKGIDGSVNIESPGTDIAGDLVILPETLIDAGHWMKKPCSARTREKSSSFVIKGRDAVSTPFDGWQPSPLMWLENRDEGDKKTED
ncbi:filamentous hemagglutinin N-terminal domain-containing protein [Desulfobacterales bacterium HSG2]|nr:filamentous hemagglutinin N-terminal domain-containing protein [Desulfobacterales bacterium HSG2]